MARRAHSSLDNLPALLKQALTAMVVDNAWPSDFQGKQVEGNPRYEDMVEYLSLIHI